MGFLVTGLIYVLTEKIALLLFTKALKYNTDIMVQGFFSDRMRRTEFRHLFKKKSLALSFGIII
jgi:hypothetical protein